ncbi:hypothetical protein PL8927_630058 [Planktothrix serta PCC 8927]|uniref:Uncharacterized protein n=1 Tax=Planktothrix serta PCC 8927 TaxID=671068 RepID=A0A7Z9BPI0_9CYAN|nr:hypothetical protein PL8927_630058 [Planktothrix serta PCC 8927]
MAMDIIILFYLIAFELGYCLLYNFLKKCDRIPELTYKHPLYNRSHKPLTHHLECYHQDTKTQRSCKLTYSLL